MSEKVMCRHAVMDNQSNWLLNYKWKLPKHFTKLFSNFIKFQDRNCFKLGILKDVAGYDSFTLFFQVFNLHCLGFKIKSVFCQVNQYHSTKKIELHKNGNNCFVTYRSGEKVIDIGGNSQLDFFVLLEGCESDQTDPPFYSLQLMDTLLATELYSATDELQETSHTDFQFIVQQKVFPVHRSILAARSPFMAKWLSMKPLDTHLEISAGTDPEIFKHFLTFIYSGQLKIDPSLELLKIAEHFEVGPLQKFCESATRKIDDQWELTKQLLILQKSPNWQIVDMSETSLHSSQKVTDRGDVSFDTVGMSHSFKISLGKRLILDVDSWSPIKYDVEEKFSFGIHFMCQNDQFYLMVSCHCLDQSKKLMDIEFSIDEEESFRTPMKNQFVPRLNQIQFFKAKVADRHRPISCINLHVKFKSAIENFQPTFVDPSFSSQLWCGLDNFSDVKFLVEGQELKAHRWVLAARSPVFASTFNAKIEDSAAVTQIVIDEVDYAVFKDFMRFIYCGSLENSARNHQLLKLAEKYHVETLQSICKNATLPHEKLREWFTQNDFFFFQNY